MRKFLNRTGVLFLCVWLLAGTVSAAQMLIPGGQVVGLELEDNTVSVAAFDETHGAAAQQAGLKVGDRILAVNKRAVKSAEDVREALHCSDGTVELTLMRNKKSVTVRVSPIITGDGPKLGVYLKQGVTGVGTVTYYDPAARRFGTLGHGVNNAKGELLKMVKGSAYEASVASVRRGGVGAPGQLMGVVKNAEPIGSLSKNTNHGVFGTLNTDPAGEPLPVAAPGEVKTGKATILSTVEGDTVQEYSVEILKLYPGAGSSGRNIFLRVTDEDLLEATGGIVQGMGVSYNRDNTGNPNSLRGFQVTDP